MSTTVFLSLLLMGQVPPQAPAKAPGIEVMVQARAIELPLLPERVDEARAGFSKMRPQIATAIQDLERDLTGLYAALAPEGPSAAFYRIPSNATDEVRLLASLLQDDPCLAMEDAVFDEWVRWQTLLLRYGLAQHLNESALRMLEFERNATPTQDPVIRILRLQAKINVLERFRSALWFCHGRFRLKPSTPQEVWRSSGKPKRFPKKREAFCGGRFSMGP